MINQIRYPEVEKNEAILARVEELGGGSVWDAEIFTVTLMDVAVTDSEAMPLTDLVGVQQIALDCSRMCIGTLQKIAAIPGLQSLVLCNPVFDAEGLQMLQEIGPEVQVVDE